MRIRPDTVVAFGGYLSAPTVFCAWLLGIDSIIHEQAAVPGLANRINALFAKKVFLTWQTTQKYFSNPTEVIGNLTRKVIATTHAKDPKIKEFLKKSKKLIFITGGNQGSHFLNLLTFELMPRLANFSILHQVGTTNYEGDQNRAAAVNKLNYLPVDYLDSDSVGAVLNRADLVIARSGANTVWDLAILAKVAILIPLPISASGEQEANSKILEIAGSAVVIEQKKASTQKILEAVSKLTSESAYYRQKAKQFSKTLPKNAAEIIAKTLIK
ncbi:glycosyltransferase [Candidatus Curtissbacteria bacterium]|nr:glycosyltransferase [Candidatus Curtissbacteria bacterium]